MHNFSQLPPQIIQCTFDETKFFYYDVEMQVTSPALRNKVPIIEATTCVTILLSYHEILN